MKEKPTTPTTPTTPPLATAAPKPGESKKDKKPVTEATSPAEPAVLPKTDLKAGEKDAPTVHAPTIKKKKQKRVVAAGHVHIQATFNNTIVTVTDTKGAVLAGASAGSSGFRGSKKGTAFAAQMASEKAITAAKAAYGLTKADVFVKGIGLGREAAIRSLAGAGLAVENIYDVTSVPHGGARPPKARRV